MQRLVGFMVIFYHMGKRVQDFWPAVSLGLLGYDMSRTQSIMRVATTASPVSGMEVRERILHLSEEEHRKAAARQILRFFVWLRLLRLKRRGAGPEQIYAFARGRLSLTQVSRIFQPKARRAGVSAGTGGHADAKDIPPPTPKVRSQRGNSTSRG